MTRFHFERPDGSPNSNVQHPSIILNPFVPPQGFPSVEEVKFVASFDSSPPTSTPHAVKFNDDGTKLYISTGSPTVAKIFQFTVSPAFSMNPDPTDDSVSFQISTQDTIPTGIEWSGGVNAGDKLFMVGDQNNKVFQYNANSAFELLPIAPTLQPVSIPTNVSTSTGLTFGGTVPGTKMYVSAAIPGIVQQYTLTSAFDVQSGVSLDGTFSTATEDNNPRSVAFSTDGETMFIAGNTFPDTIYQYSVFPAFDIVTNLPILTNSFDISAQSTRPFGLTFSNDGLQMFVLDFGSATVFQYTLPSPFQL